MNCALFCNYRSYNNKFIVYLDINSIDLNKNMTIQKKKYASQEKPIMKQSPFTKLKLSEMANSPILKILS